MSNKRTLFFSNIVGNVMEDDMNVRFNDYMSEYLIENIDNKYSMVFINAPGLGGEEYYLKLVSQSRENDESSEITDIQIIEYSRSREI